MTLSQRKSHVLESPTTFLRHHLIADTLPLQRADSFLTLVLSPGESASKSWSLARSSGWYDLIIVVDGDWQFEYRFAGHLEDGEDSISDPLMGGLV